MSPSRVPFAGVPPEVADGDQVEVRDAAGRWRRTTARSGPRYDEGNAQARRCHLSVSVDHPGFKRPVNWPAEDVRPAGEVSS